LTRRQRLALVGTASVLGALPLPAVGVPDDDEPVPDPSAELLIVTPGTTTLVAEELPGGHRVTLGDTGIGNLRIALAPGPHQICLTNPSLGTLCREIDAVDGETYEWIVWPAELSTVDALIELPTEVRTVRVVVDGVPGEPFAVEGGSLLPVPPLRDVWLEMRDRDGGLCLCHPPVLPALRRYRCPWSCGPSSDR